MIQMNLKLRLYDNDILMEETGCLSLSLNKEAYTPYNELSAVFFSGDPYGWLNRVALYLDDTELFFGLVDRVEQFRKNGKTFVKVRARSFTALLLQNELERNIYANMTIGELMTNYCQIPHVTYEQDNRTGYIYVKDGTTLWDCIACFGYKLTHHYPYVIKNKVCISPPSSAKLHEIPDGAVVEYGSVNDSTKLISHFHMADITGTEGYYWFNSGSAIGMDIVRHKWIDLDKQFLMQPMDALTFRNIYAKRGWRSRFVTYEGFDNEDLGDLVSFGEFLPGKTVCRVLFTFGQNGVRTKLWAYEDGLYNIS